MMVESIPGVGGGGEAELLEPLLDQHDFRSHDADKSYQQCSSFCWRNVSVWGRQRETQGLLRKTTYRNFEIVQKNKCRRKYLDIGDFLDNVLTVTFAETVEALISAQLGSGKTTLLAAISRRLRERVFGDVYVNGHVINSDQMLTISSFVPQDSLTIQSLTVWEHFKMMAALRMDRNTSESFRTEKISLLIQEIGLSNLASSYLFSLSGGEIRRISIAVQLLTDPLLLFCDEPTTGLDSAYTAVVVKMLKKFSSGGKIVICSIHQPAASIYELFDQVLLLASGGRVAYFGPVMQGSDYFENLGLICPPNYNIAEFLINNVSFSDFDATERITTLCRHYSSSTMKRELESQIHRTCIRDEHIVTNALRDSDKDRMTSLAKYFNTKKPSTLAQTIVLVQRSCLNLRHDNVHVFLHIFNLIYVSVLVTLFSRDVTLCSENSIRDIRGVLFILVAFSFFIPANFQVQSLLSERQSVMREINDGLYSIEAYCIAKLLGKLVYSISVSFVVVSIFMSISRACTHLSIWNLFLPLTINTMTATAYGCMLASAFDNLNMLFCGAYGYETVNYMLAGIAVNLNSLPVILSYFRYVTVFYYLVEYIQVMEWRNALNEHIQCENVTRGPQAALRMLADNGYDVQHFQKNLLILIFFSFIFFMITYLFLRKKKKERVAY